MREATIMHGPSICNWLTEKFISCLQQLSKQFCCLFLYIAILREHIFVSDILDTDFGAFMMSEKNFA